jgi:hypothetical protein
MHGLLTDDARMQVKKWYLYFANRYAAVAALDRATQLLTHLIAVSPNDTKVSSHLVDCPMTAMTSLLTPRLLIRPCFYWPVLLNKPAIRTWL